MSRVTLFILMLFAVSCLKTRSDLGDNYQSDVYTKKQADNQAAEAQSSTAQNSAVAANEEKDELIRNLNGRIEVLENQISQLHKEKTENTDAEKIKLLQESLTKMENQIQQLESVASLKNTETKVNETKATEDKKADSHDKVPAKNSSDEKELNKSNVSKLIKEATKDDKLKNQATSTFDKAQSYFAAKDFKNAILEYQKFVDEKPKSTLVPESKYKMGLCFEALGLKDEAYSFYEEVAAQYAKTDFGKKAKAKVSAKSNSSSSKKK